jgi:tRNA(Ile)-lysidine synthase
MIVSDKTGLLDAVKAFITKHRMLQNGRCVVAAVSGGPDSTALLHILGRLRQELGFHIVVAHLDHKLREDSALDAEFTRETARALGIDIIERTVDVRSLATEKGMSVEEAGRIARYAFFEEVRNSAGAQVIATAHHLDDEIETFFLRIFRGSSPKGLRGILPVRGRIIRPLLCATRQQIMAVLDDEHIPYRVDPTNLQDNTDRNFVRNRLIPLVKERFPDFSKPLKRSMDLIEREESLLEDLTSKLYAQAVSKTGCGLSIDVSTLRSAHEALAARVIVFALYEVSGAEVRWQRSHVDAVLKMVRSDNPSAEVHLPGGPVVYREYERIVLSREAPKSEDGYVITVSAPGTVHLPAADMTLGFRILTRDAYDPEGLCQLAFKIPSSPPFSKGRTGGFLSSDESNLVLAATARALFDADQVSFPLTVRSPMVGDRFRPWGIDGTRKLKKVLIDAKVPLRERRSLPLVLKGEEILWIPRIRRSRAAPITPHTKRILEICLME